MILPYRDVAWLPEIKAQTKVHNLLEKASSSFAEGLSHVILWGVTGEGAEGAVEIPNPMEPYHEQKKI